VELFKPLHYFRPRLSHVSNLISTLLHFSSPHARPSHPHEGDGAQAAAQRPLVDGDSYLVERSRQGHREHRQDEQGSDFAPGSDRSHDPLHPAAARQRRRR